MKAYNQRYSELTSKTRLKKKHKKTDVYTKSDHDNVNKNQKTS